MPAPLLIPLVSLGIKAITTGASYLQERKFKKQAEAAERKADQALADVNKQIQKDFYSGISLPTEAYERAMEGIMSSTADVVTRAQEADPRGLGSVESVGDGSQEVQPDFELIAFDFVSNPSTHGAFLHPMNESVDKQGRTCGQYCKAEDIINHIIRGE